MEEFMESVNTEEVAAPQAEQPEGEVLPDEISAEAEQGAKEEELAAPQSERDFEKDAAFAQMRREMEQAQRENRKLQEALGKFNFHGSSADDMLDQVEAYHSGQSVEEIRRSRQARERLMSLEQENVALRQRESRRVFADDLAEIRKQYPDVKVRDIGELGPDFIMLRASGVDNLMAYEVVRKRQEMDKKPIPPSTGSVKSTGGSVKEYFTASEVRAMSPSEVKKNYAKIRKSMQKW